MWKEKDQKLVQSFKFKDFGQAFAFMTQVAIQAEKNNHHPWWSNVYNQVDIELCTHDEGDIITHKDRDLASLIDQIFKQYQ